MAAMEGIKKLKAEEGEEEEEEEEDLVDPAMEIKERCGEDNCIGAKVRRDLIFTQIESQPFEQTIFKEIVTFYSNQCNP